MNNAIPTQDFQNWQAGLNARKAEIVAEFTCPLLARVRIMRQAASSEPLYMIRLLRRDNYRALTGRGTAGAFPHKPKESVQDVILSVLARYEELFFMLRDSGRFVASDEIQEEMMDFHREIKKGNF